MNKLNISDIKTIRLISALEDEILAVCRRESFFSNENNVKLMAIIRELQTS